jgi:hypothetical protein
MTSEDRYEVLRLDDIVPYWRNPRVITDEAVNAVAASITNFGYQQPIVVDASNVIIMGHTRYAAMRRLGVTEAEVRIAASLTAEQSRKLRVLDNRLHEYTRWDFDLLVDELEDLDAGLMRGYFPEVVAPDDSGPGYTAQALAEGAGSPTADQSDQVTFTCPSCFSEFEKQVTREMVMSGRIEA